MNPAIAAQQQGSPLRQAAQGGMGGAQEAMQGAPSMQLVKKLMGEVGERLNGVAKILQTEKPEMIPLLKPVVQGLAMLMNDVEKSAGQQGGAPPQGAAPPPQADPQGGEAMGMASNGGGSAPAA